MSSNIKSIKDLVLNESICTLPWHGFALFPNGDVRNCAISNELLGNLHTSDLDDILSNSVSRSVRQDMIDGTKHQRCNTCYRTEDLQNSNPLSKISNRIWYMKVMKNHDLGAYDQTEFVSPQILDLRWRNTCNYRCVYCGPSLSSRWASDRNKSANFTIDEHKLAETKKYIFDNIKTIKHVYLAGGEPLLIKENLEVLERLKEHNPNVTIRINTNLSVINNKIFKLLVDDFKNTKWTISVDSIEEDYNYIRYPGDWNNFLKNLTYLYSKTKNINYNMTWSVLNAYSIFDAIDFLQQKFSCPDSVFVIQPIFEPRTLHISHLSTDVIDDLRSVINKKLSQCESSLYKNSLQSMLSYLDLSCRKNLDRTIKFLNIINKQQGLDFPQSLAHLLEKEIK